MTVVYVVVGVVAVVGALVAWSACVAAGHADEFSERLYHELEVEAHRKDDA